MNPNKNLIEPKPYWPDVFVGFFSFLKAGGGAFLEEEKLYKLPTYLLIKIGKQQTINF